jgi:protein SCO1/2
MSYRKAIAIAVVLVLPVVSYLIVEKLSRGAVRMPRRYFYDSVTMVTLEGKTRPDTAWHRVRPFRLTNQFGREVSLSSSPPAPVSVPPSPAT